ncbi:hypothetical protein KGA66_28665, partial [Actinocrinis puniceicyclus]
GRVARDSRAFSEHAGAWSAVIVAIIAAVGSVAAALVTSSPSVSVSASAKAPVTIVEAPGGRDPLAAASVPAANFATTAAPSPTRSAPTGHWIVQLASVPHSDGVAARDQQLQQVQTTFAQAQWLESDDYGALLPGFWVIYVDGPFHDGAAAYEYCLVHGRSAERDCLGRYLSNDPADHGLQCAWSGTANPPAVCYAKSNS